MSPELIRHFKGPHASWVFDQYSSQNLKEKSQEDRVFNASMTLQMLASRHKT